LAGQGRANQGLGDGVEKFGHFDASPDWIDLAEQSTNRQRCCMSHADSITKSKHNCAVASGDLLGVNGLYDAVSFRHGCSCGLCAQSGKVWMVSHVGASEAESGASQSVGILGDELANGETPGSRDRLLGGRKKRGCGRASTLGSS
jgi:hypothetical protein